MDRQPDLVVVSPDDAAVHLVVEVKARPYDLPSAEHQLKEVMVRMRAPVGLLVSASVVAIYRDTFQSYTPSSVQAVGAVQTSSIPELQAFSGGLKKDPLEFEVAVQNWLEGLQYRLMQGYGRGADALLVEHVMPALALGEIRPAGPRAKRALAR